MKMDSSDESGTGVRYGSVPVEPSSYEQLDWTMLMINKSPWLYTACNSGMY